MVELAVIFPIVMALLMAVIDFSFMLYGNVQLAGSCGEAARAGARFSGDLSLSLIENDAARAAAIRDAVYNTSTGQTTLGLLRTYSPYFEIDGDVEVSYPGAASSVTRSGDEMVVTMNYRQPVWFSVIPGTTSGTIPIKTSVRVRIR